MGWVKVNAAAVAFMLGLFVAAIPPASIEARAHAAPLATDEPGVQGPGGPDIGAGDDDSDDSEDDDSEDMALEQQNEQAEQQGQMDQPN
ncbi:MAG: hypothetical protein QOC63_1439 [Mycobacterium sp.]|jgi:hypothetical protein|nr:hypothetical protein [Mycobacterium sp.]